MFNKLKKLIGTKQFYKTVCMIALPIMLQQGITNFVNLIDNVMIGQLNTSSISGVAIANQIMFVVNTCIFGGLGGAGIFLAQYYGASNKEGMRQTFRVKVIFCVVITIVSLIILGLYRVELATLFLKDSPDAVVYAEEYLFIMMFATIPYAISQLYGSSFKEIGKTRVPMVAGIIAILVNVVLNYILIFGHFGAPALGVRGAAIATFIARIIEALILVVVAHKRHESFSEKVYFPFTVSIPFAGRVLKKSVPLLLNELMWSLGTTMLVYAYSIRGEEVVAAFNIANTTTNLFYVIFSALATGISVMVGNELGANKIQEARENANKLIAFGVSVGVVLGMMLIAISPFIPLIYEVDDSTRQLATSLMQVVGFCIPIFVFNVGCFFTLRAGGSTVLTFMFDSGFMWLFPVPLGIVLARYTLLPIVLIYTIVQLCDILKSFIGIYLVSSGKWAKNLAVESK